LSSALVFQPQDIPIYAEIPFVSAFWHTPRPACRGVFAEHCRNIMERFGY